MKIYKLRGTCILLAEVSAEVVAINEKDAKRIFKQKFAEGNASIDADRKSACSLQIEGATLVEN